MALVSQHALPNILRSTARNILKEATVRALIPPLESSVLLDEVSTVFGLPTAVNSPTLLASVDDIFGLVQRAAMTLPHEGVLELDNCGLLAPTAKVSVLLDWLTRDGLEQFLGLAPKPNLEFVLEALRTGRPLVGWNLQNLDLSSQRLSGGLLAYAHLEGTKFNDGADLSYADLAGAKLARTDFGGANLSHARFSNAKFFGTILKDAKLRGTDLRGVDLSHLALLKGTNLKQARLSLWQRMKLLVL